MEKMTPSEFKNYVECVHPKKILFNASDQDWDTPLSAFNIEATFFRVIVAISPNVVCFRNELDVMYLERVKYIEIYSDNSFGTIWNIICDDIDGRKSFKVLAA